MHGVDSVQGKTNRVNRLLICTKMICEASVQTFGRALRTGAGGGYCPPESAWEILSFCQLFCLTECTGMLRFV